LLFTSQHSAEDTQQMILSTQTDRQTDRQKNRENESCYNKIRTLFIDYTQNRMKTFLYISQLVQWQC